MTNLCGVEFNLGFVLRGQLPFPNYSSFFREGSGAIGVFRWVGGVFLLACWLCGYFGSLKYAGTIFCEAADGDCAFLVMVCCSTLVWSSNVDVAIFGPRGLLHMPLLDPHSYCIRVASQVVVKPTSWCLRFDPGLWNQSSFGWLGLLTEVCCEVRMLSLFIVSFEVEIMQTTELLPCAYFHMHQVGRV